MRSRCPCTPLFPLGHINISGAVFDQFDGRNLRAVLKRHAGGDWGEVSPEQSASNQSAVKEGGGICSCYRNQRGDEVRVYTVRGGSWTMLMTPEEDYETYAY